MAEPGLEAKFLKSSLKDKWPFLKPLARNAVIAAPKKSSDKKLAVGASKLGGHPDLPKGQAWPKTGAGIPLAFIGQIDFAAAAAFDKDGHLPKQGLACFFYDAEQEAWGFDPKDADRFKVLYFPSTAGLERREPPEDLPEEAHYKVCALTFAADLSLPYSLDDRIEALVNDQEADEYVDLTDPECKSKLLGYADPVQDEMELECALVTHGIYCGDAGGHDHPRAKELQEEQKEWKLLLQVDSVEDCEMMWGDCGRLYYWIKQGDLDAGDFGKAWMILQCG